MQLFKADARYLASADGTTVYADAVGDPSNPHIGIFVHATWVDLCFSQPDDVSYELKRVWIDAALAVTPADLALMINRPQSLIPFLKLAQEGTWPMLLLQGDADAVIDAEKVVPVVKSMWKDPQVMILKGIGHASFYEDTRGVMDAIGDFAKRVLSEL